MRILRYEGRKYQLFVVLFGFVLIASGCFQGTVDNAEPTPESLIVPSPTQQVPPTQNANIQQTQNALQVQQTQSDQQVSQTQEALIQQQTQIARQARQTERALVATQTSGAPVDNGTGNNNIVPTQDPNLDEFALSATARIAQVTMTVALQQTQTAIFLRGTPTPVIPTTVPGQPTPTQQVPSQCVYIVQPGDNLFRISLRYGVTVNEIATLNGIPNPNLILVGQRIVIPGCVPGTGSTTSTTGTTTTNTNNSQAAGTGSTTGGQQYVVQPGDTLMGISRKFGVSYQNIATANSITNPNLIIVGQTLTIPV